MSTNQTNSVAESKHINLTGLKDESWWTGAKPNPSTLGVDCYGKVFSLPQVNTATCTRQQVQDYFANGWLLNEVLFSALQSEEAFMRVPYHGLRHPMIFYYGHTACFFVNKLLVAGLIAKPINAYFERLFEVGVDEMSWDDMSKNEITWPRVHEVTEYRRQVFELVSNLIATHPGLCDEHKPILGDNPLWSIFMGMEHERIHLETSSVLIREMPLKYLCRPQQWPMEGVQSDIGIKLEMIDVPEGEITLGKDLLKPFYSWDNEYGSRHAEISSFQISRNLVTNEQFKEFVASGGYLEREYWSKEGWAWRTFRNTKHPTFWVPSGPDGMHDYALRTLFGERPLPADWPVCVNYHEAKAFMAWMSQQDGNSYRLPTEAEHSYLRNNFTPDLVMDCRSSDYIQLSSETSVHHGIPNSLGVNDLEGNLWDWCEDDFHPLQGFKINRLYDDFSTPCFDGEHKMILGGSFMSTGNEAALHARFHFRPHFHQHAGFHLVCQVDTRASSGAVILKDEANNSKYENSTVLDQYMLLHFGEEKYAVHPIVGEAAARFPQRCAQKVIEMAAGIGCQMNKVLDIGCAVGAASFELASAFKNTTGVDISEQFIRCAKTLHEQGSLTYQIPVEGEIKLEAVANMQAPRFHSGLNFRRADACCLPAEYVDFDAVLVANLLCHLPSPTSLLSRMGGMRGLVKPGGIVVFASPFSFSEQFTPRDSWLGGRVEDGVAQFSAEAMQVALGEEFALISEDEFPFMIREHARKFEFVVSHVTAWQRRT